MLRFTKTAVIASFLCFSTMVSFADLPSLRLDGSWGKGELYRDPYKYDNYDREAAAKNPYRIGIMKRVAKGDDEYETIMNKIKSLPKWDVTDKELQERYVKSVKTEYDLTEKELQTAKAYPGQFPHEAKTGKRVYVSRVMKLGDKQYRANSCRFFGAGDWNGDGVNEVFLRWDDGATHAGAHSTINVFSENGDFVFFIDLQTIHMGPHRVFDYNGDGKVELVVMPDGSKDECLVLACPQDGEELDAYSMPQSSRDEIMSTPSPIFVPED